MSTKYKTGVRIGQYSNGQLCMFISPRRSHIDLFGDDLIGEYVCEKELSQEDIKIILDVIRERLQEMSNA